MRNNFYTAILISCVIALTILNTNAAGGKLSMRAQGKERAGKAGAKTTNVSAVTVITVEEMKKLLARGGGKTAHPLLVNFWATWCEPCRAEFPELVKINDDFKTRGLDFLTISLDEVSDAQTTVPQFLTEMKANAIPAYLLNASDPETAITTIDPNWNSALPTTFLFDAQGALIYKHMGIISPAELRAQIEKAVTSDK